VLLAGFLVNAMQPPEVEGLLFLEGEVEFG
jgi:hypothetical protein